MKIKLVINVCCILVTCFFDQSSLAQSQSDSSVYFADPTIFQYRHNYYLYGTDGFNADSGFRVAVSSDLIHWKKSSHDQRVLSRGETFGTKGFWAPQVFKHHGKIYMAYTASEHIAIAEGPGPKGPFRQKIREALSSPVKQIDPFIFKDDDGKLYLYFVHLQNGNRIWGAILKNDLSGIDTTTSRECISADVNPQSWENTQSANWTVTEGPTVVKRGKKYFMFYSANDFRNPDYAVGYATADHPLGPWKKSEQNPIISRQLTGVNGPGHGDIIADNRGNFYYVFHTHYSNEKVAPRKTAMVKMWFSNKNSEEVKFDFSFFYFLKYGE
ncbi:MAG: glycoside hydrolase family 43 protein [Bacteroidetes bacterium]|nr:glycoside hydrolase family 43 protein [Bacteroidota bacterium]